MAAFREQHGIRPPTETSGAEPGDRPSDAPLLGQLLLDGGLLSEEQLAAGLAEQQRTGAPLGKALIDLNLVDTASVALALATQHGGLIKTEYGFATPVRQHAPGTPLAEPPLSPSSPGGTPVSSDAHVALPHAVRGPASAPDSPPPVFSDQVEPEPDLPGEVESVPVQPTEGVVAENLAEPAGGIDAVGSEPQTELPARTEEAKVAPVVSLAPPPPQTEAEAEPAELAAASEQLAEVDPDPAPGAPQPTPAATDGSADGQAVLTGPPAGEHDREPVLRDVTMVEAKPGLSLIETAEPPVAADETRVDVDPVAAGIADRDAELAANGDDQRLRAQVTVLELELEAARLAVKTASAESRAAHAAAENAAARIVHVEHELAAVRSENDLLRAAAEQVQTDQLPEQLVSQRLTEIEQRLEAAYAQIAALQTRTD
jgi:hypothetical protein